MARAGTASPVLHSHETVMMRPVARARPKRGDAPALLLALALHAGVLFLATTAWRHTETPREISLSVVIQPPLPAPPRIPPPVAPQIQMPQIPLQAPPQIAVEVQLPQPPPGEPSSAITAPTPPPSPPPAALAPPPDYAARLAAQLNAVLRYPVAARLTHRQGTVLIAFTLDRSGKVLNSRLVRSAGARDLDDEALAMVEEAAPFPPFPKQWIESQREFTVPVSFNLKNAR